MAIMNVGHLITIWTIRAALLCYVGVLGARWAFSPNLAMLRRLRTVWSLGCCFFVTHVCAAFHFVHHWSHQHAFDDTARQTDELLGWAFGGGIFFSYVFLLLWVADVAWWWLREESYLRRPLWLNAAIHVYLFFIAFNGAVIFEGGVTRIGGIFATVGLAALAVWRATATRRDPAKLAATDSRRDRECDWEREAPAEPSS